MTPNWVNRALFHGDNLDFMRAMNSESVDLIATDPPFNKGRDFHATPDSLAAGASFQDRWSWEKDVHQEWVDQLTDDHPALMEAIESAMHAHSEGMGAYMCFMAVRLLAMRRILKPTGAIYLHCDPTASHYLKAVMDAIFGEKNFRNQIVWCRTPAKALMTKRLPTNHDLILSYQRTDQAQWNSDAVFVPYDPANLDDKTAGKYRHRDADGRVFRLDSLINPNKDRPNLTYEFLGVTRVWRWTRERMQKAYAEGIVVQSKPGRVPQLKRYLDEQRGRPMGDVWSDIAPINSRAQERLGYPTQKPLALYERIIRASSNEGDIVLDPFCGCATTCVAAERLNRQWAGIDIWDKAHEVVIKRLHDEVGLFGNVHYSDNIPKRTDDGQTAAPYLKVKQSIPEPPGRKMSRAEMYDILLSQQGKKCQGCDRKFDDARYLELDHNTPRADGGPNHISNRILLCGPCNRLKGHIYTLSGLRRENKKRGYMRESA